MKQGKYTQYFENYEKVNHFFLKKVFSIGTQGPDYKSMWNDWNTKITT